MRWFHSSIAHRRTTFATVQNAALAHCCLAPKAGSAGLTGMPAADLLAPANVRGFWFISVSSRVTNCTEIVNGAIEVNDRMREIVAQFLATSGSDSRLRMWRDAPWFRIEIERPQVRDVMCIDFTRCQPDSNGLKWIDASWRDTLFLHPGMVELAYANAGFVTDFAGKTVPEDLMRLRIVVTENNGAGKVLRRMVVRGAIADMPESVPFKEK